ncbi:MAG: hypothetical protein RL641_918 [Candidatus Parcubacteria bacterium]|jgi:hypothetical protein
MNKYEHAENSAKIFGGKSKDYEAFHALIDFNKVVTPSIFGRFFLHHIDVGLLILEKIFGNKIGPKNVPAKQLLMQHLLEDYDQLLTFEKHWMPAIEETDQMPKLDTWPGFLEKAKKDSRLQKLTDSELVLLDAFFQLKTLVGDKITFRKNTQFAILGHALGAEIATHLLGPKIYGLWTSDVVTGYLNCRFVCADRYRDPVPTLLDYERHVPNKPWMHAPKDYEDVARRDPKRIKKMIEETIKTEKMQEMPPQNFDSIRRSPCNID